MSFYKIKTLTIILHILIIRSNDLNLSDLGYMKKGNYYYYYYDYICF